MLTILKETLRALAFQRALFHSKADWQHALAWDLHQRLPNAQVRLEYPLAVTEHHFHLDVWLGDKTNLAVELRYPTRPLKVNLGEEAFTLPDTSGDSARHEFVRGVQKLEQLTAARNNTLGYVLLLSNDSSLWESGRKTTTPDKDFRIEHGRILNGALKWGGVPPSKTKPNTPRESAIVLRGRYILQWENFAKINVEKNGQFRYLLVEVK